MRREKDHDDSSRIFGGYRSTIPDSGAMAARRQDSRGRTVRTRQTEGLADTIYGSKTLQRREEKTEAGQAEKNKAREIDPGVEAWNKWRMEHFGKRPKPVLTVESY
jgi:hypothetical protein